MTMSYIYIKKKLIDIDIKDQIKGFLDCVFLKVHCVNLFVMDSFYEEHL